MENRLKMIYDSASNLFINKGYARTQIKDIAKEIGLSAGMVYVYFTSKSDILRFILKSTIDKPFLSQDFEFPVNSELFVSLDKEIIETFENNIRQFSSHSDRIADYPLKTMLSDAFDIISEYGVACLIIERNPDDVGKLFDYYKEYRKKFYAQVLSYIKYYMENGMFRKIEYPEYCTRLIVETISWWGMHMMNNAFEIRKDIPRTLAKSVCMDNLIHAYQI